jgi:hypothetical protein
MTQELAGAPAAIAGSDQAGTNAPTAAALSRVPRSDAGTSAQASMTASTR